MLSFLRNLDTATVERKQFLGENFTPEELASVDRKLYIGPIKFDELELPAPLALPKPEYAESPMTELALEVYRTYQKHIQRLLK
jgi:hypothetical protein